MCHVTFQIFQKGIQEHTHFKLKKIAISGLLERVAMHYGGILRDGSNLSKRITRPYSFEVEKKLHSDLLKRVTMHCKEYRISFSNIFQHVIYFVNIFPLKKVDNI